MLATGGKVAGSGSHKGALLVLSAEKTMLQAGMNSAAFADDDGSGWDSNILRNTEQVAFMIAAAANKLALEAQLITTEPEMDESLASVVRGLISLLASRKISRPIEEAVGVIAGLRRLSSVSRAGVSDVVLEFSWDSEMSDSTQDVLEKLDLVFLPSLVFGFFKDRTGRLTAPILLHSFYNAGFLLLFTVPG